MTNMNIYKSLGGLDLALVAMAAPAERVPKKKKTAWIGWVSAAACFVLLFSVSAWMFVPGLGTYEDCLISMLVPIGDEYYVEYNSSHRDMSNFDRLTLGGRIGEVFRAYETSTLYKIKGHDDIAELICVWDDGRILLLRAGSVEVLDTHIEPPTLDFLLKTVYGVRSAADIKCVRFEKITKSNTDFSKKVKVKTVTVTDKEQLALLNYSVGSRIFKKVKMHLKILHLISDHRTHLSRNATGKNTFFVNLLAPELCSFFM